MAQPTPPTYEPPRSVPTEWTVDALKQHLQTACLLELHTIPLYLAAAYSIVGNDLAVYKIITVVKQEMLHLSLSGNLLCAIGGEPKIYGPKFTPHYPALIFYDQTQLDLKPAVNATISTFRRIEQPLEPSRGPKAPEWLLPEYKTIGQFYAKTMEGLEVLYDQFGQELFKPESIPKQFQTADGSWYDGDMTAITDITSAKEALTLVIEQGEGSTGNVPIMNTIHTHYEIFKELEEWPDLDNYVSNVIENPITEDLKDEEVYPVMKAGDAAYCYLLLSIEKAWTYAGPRRQELVTNNIMNLMLAVLKPMGRFLVQQELKTGEELRAGLAFNLFEFSSTGNPYNELKSQMDAAVSKYPNAEELTTAKRAVDGLVDLATLR